MGLRDWFSGRRRPRVAPDSVWLSHEARLAGLADKAQSLSAGGLVLALAHFPGMLDDLEETMKGRLSVRRADSDRDVASWLAAPEPGFVALARVDQLPSESPDLVGRADGRVTFLVAERHPLRALDDRIEQLAAALPYETSVQFVLSFDDPLLERFVGERVRDLFDRLGMSEDEELSHPLIASAVERAQRQLAEHATDEVQADSASEWLDTVGPIEPG